MEALFKQDAKRKWPSIHLTHFERQGHIWLYTDFTLWSPYCSAQTLQCEQHMVLHKLYTETSYGSFRDFTIWTPYGYTETFTLPDTIVPHKLYNVDNIWFYTNYTLKHRMVPTETLHFGHHMVLHRLLDCEHHTVLQKTLQPPYGSTQTLHLRHRTVCQLVTGF